jgi:uncharacterized membrane protein
MSGSAYLVYLMALLIGVVAGLRALTAPATVSWGVHLGWFNVDGSWLEFLGTDQLPTTPSRTTPMPFGTRLLTGALSGAAVGASAGLTTGGAAVGAVGAVIGTLAGSQLRARLASAFHNDHPAALIEDAVAIGGAVIVAFAGR